jgi:hypothetical protein
MEKKVMKGFAILAFMLMLVSPLVSAGVGISWDRESSMVPENEKTCLTYKVYNPFGKDVYAEVSVTEEFDEIMKSAQSEIKLIPSQTSSSEALPVQFCFKTPRVYERDCLLLDALICEKTCDEEMKVFEGNVVVREVTNPSARDGQGSATQMSVSAPLRVRVQCIPHDRNYTFVYIVIALIASILLAISIRKEKEKSSVKKEGSEENIKEDKQENKLIKKKVSNKKK